MTEQAKGQHPEEKMFLELEEECDRLHAEIARLRAQQDQLLAALKECGAAWASSPGTVMGAAAELGCEFKRRMQIACDAVAAVEEKP